MTTRTKVGISDVSSLGKIDVARGHVVDFIDSAADRLLLYEITEMTPVAVTVES